MMKELTFEEDVIFNLELALPYWFMLEDSIAQMREMMRIYAALRTV